MSLVSWIVAAGGIAALLAAEVLDEWRATRRMVDVLAYLVYVDGLVVTAFDPMDRDCWTRWWLTHRPAVVAMHGRSPGQRRGQSRRQRRAE